MPAINTAPKGLLTYGPFLTREEELRLVKRAQKGDSAAKDALVRAFSPLIWKSAAKRARIGVPAEDLFQEGVIGLMHAIGKFDVKSGYRLGTYAQWWLKASIQSAVEDNWSIVYEPKNKRRGGFYDLVARRGFDVSLSAPIRPGDGDQSASRQDKLVDAAAPVDEVLAEQQRLGRMRKVIRERMVNLPSRTREILEARWVTEDEPLTLGDLSDRYGVSRERIRQIEVDGLIALGVPKGSMREAVA